MFSGFTTVALLFLLTGYTGPIDAPAFSSNETGRLAITSWSFDRIGSARPKTFTLDIVFMPYPDPFAALRKHHRRMPVAMFDWRNLHVRMTGAYVMSERLEAGNDSYRRTIVKLGFSHMVVTCGRFGCGAASRAR